ncbi:FtsB family cell division protein [Nocardia transvalensis]|uniref:FtsB family cell division protein n=1 Tax=Nocardia transvalensis TaxID=37333 RepID=UPI0018945561|nr:septum formation initiator family protein [Nocardia transvalensis]MBF6330719.1 septum formation initiator family protein [Nocardia transvalensis]
MTERRARGTSPAGRGDRRSSRSARSRPERSTGGSAPAARTAAGKRAAQRRAGKPESRAGKGKSGRRSDADKHERKILGLSTGRAVILAAVLCALALTLAVPMRTYFSQRAESAQLAEQRSELENDLARLRDRRAQQQDPAYIKSEARDRLRLVMPGETPYIVQVPGIEQPAVPAQTTQARPPDPWYTELWRSMSNPQPTPAAPEPTTPAPPPPPPEGAPR